MNGQTTQLSNVEALLLLGAVFGVAWIFIFGPSVVKSLYEKLSNLGDSFTVKCPVCRKKRKFSKIRAYHRAASMTASKILEEDFKCGNGTIESGCGALLTPLYLRHPIVKKALEGATHLKLAADSSKVYAQHIDEEVAAGARSIESEKTRSGP